MNFATNAWTSPNHKAYIMITVNFAYEEEPIFMLLDLVEVTNLHSGENLAAAFTEVLGEFSISDKI